MEDKEGTKTKDHTASGHEFWKVKVAEGKPDFESRYTTYYVFAVSVATAEGMGLTLAKQHRFSEPYCYLIEFMGYIANSKDAK